MIRATPASPRMFQSDFVDYFSRTHWSVVPILYVPASAILLWYASTGVGLGAPAIAALFVAGFAIWSLTEYWLHRTLFHWVPNVAFGERLHFWVHGVHHKWPRDKYRLVMPPAVSVTLFFVFLGLFHLLLGSRLVWPFHAGFVAGYMTYDITHYYLHHRSPKSRYGISLKKHHMLHHFKTPDARFGVSSMIWDHVFGTKM